jgi:hypothetical protein
MIFYKTDNNSILLHNDYNDNLESKAENNIQNTTLNKIHSINKFTIKSKLNSILKTKKDEKYKNLSDNHIKVEHNVDPTFSKQESKIKFFMVSKSDKFGIKYNVSVAIFPNSLLFKKDLSNSNVLDILNNNCTNMFSYIPKTYNDFYKSSKKNQLDDVEYNIPSIKEKIQSKNNNTNNSTVYINGGNLELICPVILEFMGYGYSIFCIHSTINIIQYYKNDNILHELFECNNNTELCNFNISLSTDNKNNATFFNVPKKYVL